MGFPGNATYTVTYTLTEDRELRLDYTGLSDADTIFNPTNHSYFNLAGHDAGLSAMEHKIWINARRRFYPRRRTSRCCRHTNGLYNT